MQEFSSISVSSYEAGALADQLTEQSKEGWAVVSIVPTGSTVTAYLSREQGGDADTSSAPVVAEAVEAVEEAAPEAAASDETVDSPSDAGAPSEHPMPTATDGSSSSATDAVAEAPGWAAETAAPAAAEPAPAETSPSAAPAAAATTAAAGGAAPAGWYADPSSRFELRYWDGGQWTEHVSRAGQQYTDPPVA